MVQFVKGRKSRYRVQVSDETGKKKSRDFMRREDALEYEAYMIRKRQRVRAGLEEPIVTIETVEAVIKFMQHREVQAAQKDITEQTVADDGHRFRGFWLKHFDRQNVEQITARDIRSGFNQLRAGGRANTTVNKHRAMLSVFFNFCVEQGWCGKNPVSEIKPLASKVKKREHGELQHKHISKYLAEAEKIDPLRWARLAHFLVWSGCRVGEALALKGSHVRDGCIEVSQIVEKQTGKIVKRTKGKGVQAVEIRPVLPIVLTHLAADPTRAREFLFRRQNGSPLSHRMVSELHKKTLKAAEIGYQVTLHGLRHTAATSLRRMGFSTTEVQIFLGHSSVVTTERYAKPDVSHLVEKARRVFLSPTGHHRDVKEEKRRG